MFLRGDENVSSLEYEADLGIRTEIEARRGDDTNHWDSTDRLQSEVLLNQENAIIRRNLIVFP